ncbi:MAG: glycosyltransferase family 1 protein [Caldilineaceae bacterium]|nr:glycosyltransferase family 1 protein [Caldilineaceae bacterium]MBP8109177.1 glycosyltransferase family 1 protein [Caldilineaceae bacterium]MBP8122578.1 glycosyltransferase family 1 protein [Caldilineaceae bacterium]MBP9074161.1 glycosyltransferase family 1 protein [Caldilineaceae bacterium]
MPAPARITILAHGTRGDAQPGIALGKGLAARGHTVTVLASAGFEPWIRGHGLHAAPSSVDVQALMATDAGQAWSERGNKPLAQLRVMRHMLDQYGLDMANDAYAACQGADLIISQFTTMIYATSIAEKLGTPHMVQLLQPPVVATRHGGAMMNAPLPTRTSWINYLYAKLVFQPAIWQIYGGNASRFRRTTLGLPPQSRAQSEAEFLRVPFILCYSPSVVPPAPDWPSNVQTTGYLFLDEEGEQAWQPPDRLRSFLLAGKEQGASTISIGFGSMTGEAGKRMSQLVVEAVQRSGVRAVLLSGWAGLGDADLPQSILCLDAAPHGWLFPRIAAVVHHGGAGTTAAALRVGTPPIIVPHMADQPFWGGRVHALGVGPKPIPRPKLTADRLAQAIRQAVTDPQMAERATQLSAHIQAEDGLGNAIAAVERYLAAISSS